MAEWVVVRAVFPGAQNSPPCVSCQQNQVERRFAGRLMPFFKYFPPERVDVIERGLLRFTPANEFNDPFECLSDSRLVEDPRWERQIEEHCVTEMMADPVVRRRYSHLNATDFDAEVRKIHRERYALRIPELKILARDQLAAARVPLRILCLAQVAPDSGDAFLMWGHYTKNHTGFAVEFDDRHRWFTDHLPVAGQPHDAGPVEYSQSRPGWDFDAAGHAHPRREFVFTKSPHWAYEREYRLIRFAGTPGLEATNSLSLVEFPLEAIRVITLGINCGTETKKRIVAACRRHRLSDVSVRQAHIHPDEFLLTILG